MYDDVIGPPSGAPAPETPNGPPVVIHTNTPNPDFHNGPRMGGPPQQQSPQQGHPPSGGGQPRRFQLYVGNLTWVI